MTDDTRKAATVSNPFARDRRMPCDLVSPISVAEALDDERLESQCDEACEGRAPPPRLDDRRACRR